MMSQNLNHGCIKDQRPYQNQDHNVKPWHGTPSLLKTQDQDLKDVDDLCNFKPRWRVKIWNKAVSKTFDHIQIDFLMPKTGQKPPASAKALKFN